MKWNKKGLIIKANGQRDWMYSHTQVPILVEQENHIRVFFTTRPKPENGLYRAVTAYFDVDKNDLSNVINIAEKPILDYGEMGTFDEHGVMPGDVITMNNELWLYYAGWKRTVSVPYMWEIGLATSSDNGKSFKRYGKGPIMTSSYNDPYLIASGRIYQEDGLMHLFYGSGQKWLDINGQKESIYIIRRAVSKDGIHWERDEKPCIPLTYENESQCASTVFKYNNKYHMYFSYRHSTDFRNKERGYLMGYAYSDDLIHWTRDDNAGGITVSSEGWDSEMICYPYIIKINGQWVMFYCGNYFGVDGIGYAVLEE